MIMVSVALVFALQGHLHTDDGVILAVSDDTAFVLPLSSINRTDQITSATLVSIYPDIGEASEVVRLDTAVEINCLIGKWRVIEGKRIARDGTVRPTEPETTTWEKIPTTYPPVTALKAIACDGLDVLSAKLTDWQSRLPEVRAGLH